jgi:hypothetical protein
LHLGLERQQVLCGAVGLRCAAGTRAAAAGVSRRGLAAQTGQLMLEIGREHRGALETRVAHRDIGELARQIDQRQWQEMGVPEIWP